VLPNRLPFALGATVGQSPISDVTSAHLHGTISFGDIYVHGCEVTSSSQRRLIDVVVSNNSPRGHTMPTSIVTAGSDVRR
jgi:hypothetical protein